MGKESNSVGYSNGTILKTNSNNQTGLTSLTANTIVGIAMDLDNNTVQFYINGSSEGNTVALASNTTHLFGFWL